MSPHRALACYDILSSIFDHFAIPEAAWFDYDPATADANAWYTRRNCLLSRSALARSALVCRAFFVPATAVLWRDVDSLSPLIPSLRTTSPSGSIRSLQVAHPLARLPQWEVPALEYSRRVHSLFGKTLSPDEMEYLAGLPDGAGEHLLPHLRHLRWIQPVPSGMELLRVIPRSLQSLHIVLRNATNTPHLARSTRETYVRHLLKEVVARAPHLRYLRVSTDGDLKESWLDSIDCFENIETVDILHRVYTKVTTTPLIRPLSSLPKLEHLKIRLPIDIPTTVGTTAFPALRSLTLDAMFAPLRAVSEFLSLISSHELSSLVVQNCECTTNAVGAGLYQVCDVIRTQFAPSLRQLELSLRCIGRVATEAQPLIRTIEPLLMLHDLTDVRIAIAPEVAVVPASKHDLKAMAEAWPRATRLHLCYYPSTASPSLNDVEGFVKQCAGLTDLVLPGIDATTPVDHETNAKTTVRALCSARGAHRLRSLCLSDGGWNSIIPDPSRLARFLDALFPEVEWTCPPLASEHWRETIQEVLSLRIMRRVRV